MINKGAKTAAIHFVMVIIWLGHLFKLLFMETFRHTQSWIRQDRGPSSSIIGLPCGSDGKEPACYAGDPGPIPGSGRSPGEGNGYPLLNSRLENSMDRLESTGSQKSRTRLIFFTSWMYSLASPIKKNLPSSVMRLP